MTYPRACDPISTQTEYIWLSNVTQAVAEDPVAGVPSEAVAEAAGWAVRLVAAAAWEAAAGSKEAPEEEAPEDRGAAPGAEDQVGWTARFGIQYNMG